MIKSIPMEPMGMKDIIAFNLIIASEHLERLDVLLSETKLENFDPQRVLKPGLRKNIALSYRDIGAAAEALNAPVTRLAAERARKRLSGRKDPITFADLKAINSDVQSRFHDEIGEARFYCLQPGAGSYYSPSEPHFGLEVEARIPRAADDISEAGKCFAVGRYTAVVFHLMRAMEAGVQKISENLGVNNVEREWGKLLSDIHGKIAAMPRGGERDEWSQVHANLYHVKQAWRNDTMHPKATYTEEEAREVFDAMKAFMRHLASMLSPTLGEIIAE